MIRYLGFTLAERRFNAQPHKLARDFGAAADIAESQISRFERCQATPRDGWEHIVNGYADVLGVDPVEIWREALERYQADPVYAGLDAFWDALNERRRMRRHFPGDEGL